MTSSRAGDRDDDGDHGDPHQGQAASDTDTAGVVFDSLFDIHYVLMVITVSQLNCIKQESFLYIREKILIHIDMYKGFFRSYMLKFF